MEHGLAACHSSRSAPACSVANSRSVASRIPSTACMCKSADAVRVPSHTTAYNYRSIPQSIFNFMARARGYGDSRLHQPFPSAAGPAGHWLWPHSTKGPACFQEETGLSNSPVQCSGRLALAGASARNAGTLSAFVGVVGACTPVRRAIRCRTPCVRRHRGTPAQSNPASLAECGL